MKMQQMISREHSFTELSHVSRLYLSLPRRHSGLTVLGLFAAAILVAGPLSRDCFAQEEKASSEQTMPAGTASAPPPALSGESDAAQSMELSEQPPHDQYDHGPRAGFMRSGGALNSELLLGPGNGFRLHFVDASWVDVDITGSSLEAALSQRAAKAQPLRCAVKPSAEKPQFYMCELPTKAIFASSDRVFIRYIGQDKQEALFTYTFPFSSNEGAQPFPNVGEAKTGEQAPTPHATK